MKNRAAAAASTFMALISTAESFISTPASASTGGGTNRVTSSAAPCAVGRARAPAGCTPAPLEGCCRVGGVRRRRGTGALRLQAKGGRAPGAGAATQQKRQQQATESTRSSAEGAIDGKRQGEVEQLKKKLQRERAFNQTVFLLFVSVCGLVKKQMTAHTTTATCSCFSEGWCFSGRRFERSS